MLGTARRNELRSLLTAAFRVPISLPWQILSAWLRRIRSPRSSQAYPPPRGLCRSSASDICKPGKLLPSPPRCRTVPKRRLHGHELRLVPAPFGLWKSSPGAGRLGALGGEAEGHQPPPAGAMGSEGGGAVQEGGPPAAQPKPLVLFLLSNSSGVICLTQVNNLPFFFFFFFNCAADQRRLLSQWTPGWLSSAPRPGLVFLRGH